MHYFITGATGFIGRRLCEKIVDGGDHVTALVRSHDQELESWGVKQVSGDLLEPDTFSFSLKDVNVLIHCAGDAVFGNGPHYAEVNRNATVRLIELIKSQVTDLERFVFVSSIGAIDRKKNDNCLTPLDADSPPSPSSDYGRSKLEAEKSLKTSGIPYTIVRPAMVVGDAMRINSHFSVFARSALTKSLLARIRWPGSLSVVHVDDLCDALILCSKSERALNSAHFCAGEKIAIEDFYDMCRKDYIQIPISLLSPIVSRIPAIFPFKLKAMILPALVASDQSLRNIGWKPKYTAVQALDEVVNREAIRLNPDLPVPGSVVITGAASGLGKALALRLAPIRNNLILIDKNREQLSRVTSRMPNSTGVVCDLADENAIRDMLNRQPFINQRVSELYACAGFGARGQLSNIDLDLQLAMLKTNLLSRLLLVHWMVNHARRYQFARIVLISSSSAFQPLPFMTTYAASNAAVLFMGEGVAAEVEDSGVSVLTACPGGMETGFQKAAGVRELENEKLMTPEDVAEAIMKSVRNNDIVSIISFRSFAMSILVRLIPRRLSLLLWRRLMANLR